MARLFPCSLFCSMALVALSIGCGSGVHSDDVLLNITTKNSLVAVGHSTQFHVTAQYLAGATQDLTTIAAWTSDASDIAVVTRTGLVSCLSSGTSGITATSTIAGMSQKISASESITCVLPKITVAGVPTLSLVGTKAQLQAIATYPDGSSADVSPLASWSTGQLSIASFDAREVLVCNASGITTIVVEVPIAGGTVEAIGIVSVTCSVPQIMLTGIPALELLGTSSQLRAKATYADGTFGDITSSGVWASSAPPVLDVDAHGLVTCKSVGTAVVTISAHGGAASSQLTCSVPQLSISGLGPVSITGQVKQLSVHAVYVDGSSSDVTSTAMWGSSNGIIATVAGGRLRCLSDGISEISAAMEGAKASLTLTCSTPKLILSGVGNLNLVGQSMLLRANVSYADGTSQDVTGSVHWSAGSPSVAGVDTGGIVTCNTSGSSQILASWQVSVTVVNIMGIAPITCSVPKISLPGVPTFILLGQTKQLSAIASYVDGSSSDITGFANWSSSAQQVASVDQRGLLTCVTTGITQISASANGSSTSTPVNCSLPRLTVSGMTGLNLVGKGIQLRATSTFADGSSLDVTAASAWKSSTLQTATVDGRGVVTCASAGRAQVSASSQIPNSSTLITDSEPILCTVPSITISGPSSIVSVGETAQLGASALYADGTTANITASGTWSISSFAYAAVDSNGLVTCNAAGAVQVKIMSGGGTGSYAITCSNPKFTVTGFASLEVVGHTTQLHATLAYADGSSIDITNTTLWASSNSLIASVDQRGLISCLAAGTSNITGTWRIAGTATDLSESNTITCSVPKISITGLSLVEVVGLSTQLHAAATYVDGTSKDITSLSSWSTSSPSIALIDAHALLICGSVGSAQVSASLEGASSSILVNCTVPELIISDPEVPEVVGHTWQLHVSANYSDGSSKDMTAFTTWTGATSSVSVGSHGSITCNAPGIAQVVATLVLAGTTTTVSSSLSVACTVPTITITGVSSYLLVGRTALLLGIATYANGSSSPISTGLSWSSSNPSIASVDSNGGLTCTGPGSASITATMTLAGSNTTITGTLSLECSTPVLTVVGPSGPLAVGQTVPMSASATFPNGTTSDVTSAAVWSTLASTIALVGINGKITCVSSGNLQVTVSYGGAIKASAITCVDKLTSIIILPSSVSTRVGTPIQLVANGLDENGNPFALTDTPVWTSTSSIATITSTGIVSCVTAGSALIYAQIETLTSSVSVGCSPPSMATPSFFAEQSDDFVGPFQSWKNVKTAFGVVGDGVTDDTAAIQNAIDSLDPSGSYSVLWFPVGSYKITAPLNITHKEYFSIIGEETQRTSLIWAGASGGTMIVFDGSTHFRFSRLTLNGEGIADTAESITNLGTPGGLYATFNELSDQHIVGVNYGIRLLVDAETAVKRVFFDHLPGDCVSTGNFNTLNIFISDSLFEQCGYGVTNINGAGSFIVTNSFFDQSTLSDMSIYNTGYFSARHNTSVSSNAFFVALQAGANNGTINLQNNTILDPQTSPFQLGNLGPLMLIDNVVRQQNPSIPVLQGNYDLSAVKSVFSIGNTFSPNPGPLTADGSPFQGSVLSVDDSVTDPALIPDVPVPTDVYHPANLHRTVFDVSGFNGSAIQATVNQAFASGQPNPVVHVPMGTYNVSSTIRLPIGTDLTLVGDDPQSTSLVWTGVGTGPVLMVPTSNVAIKYLRIQSSPPGAMDGLLVQASDQTTNQVLADELMAQTGNSVSINYDGVEHLTSELSSTYTQGAITGVKVTGGPYRAAREATLGTTNFYNGSLQSEGSGTSFDVSSAGKFMVQDNWHDYGATSPHNFVLSGGGTVTEQVGLVSMNSNLPFVLNNFDGDVSLIGLQFNGGFQIASGNNHTNLLNLGLVGSDPGYSPVSTGNVQISNIAASYYIGGAGGGHVAQGPLPEPQWLRKMLAEARSEYPIKRPAMTAGANRIRLERLAIEGMANAVHITPDNPAAQLYYSVSSGGTELISTGSTCFTGAASNSVSGETQWIFQAGGEGDFQIVAANTNLVLGISASSGLPSSLVMQPISAAYSQRWMIQNLGNGRFSMTNRATGELLEAPTRGCIDLVSNGISDTTSWSIRAN